MKYISMFIFFAITLTLFVAGCKKDEAPTQTNTPPPTTTCNYTTNVVVVDGTSHAVVKTNCNTIANYLAEFLTDSSASPTGLVFMFSTTTAPAAGDYTIQPDAASVTTGQVYVEYYDPSTAWRGTTGTVKVTVTGSLHIFEFCSLTLNAGGSNNKTVSARGTCN
jgi:hypothetical protein